MTPEIDFRGEPELRTVVAFALAPGVAVAIALVGMVGAFGWPVEPPDEFLRVLGTLLTFGHLSALCVALPVYGVLPGRLRGSLVAAVLTGALTAAAPWSILAGWDAPAAVMVAAPLGAVGGFAFWTMRRRWPRWLPRPLLVRGEEGRGREHGGEQT